MARRAPLIPRLPVIPTILVGLAVVIMIALGFWQLDRAEWKEDLLTRYRGAAKLPGEVAWPRDADSVEPALYRRSSLLCERVLSTRATAGRSERGAAGWAHMATCALDGGGTSEVALGWSSAPLAPQWAGGMVTGFVAPAGKDSPDDIGARLVAAPPLASLEPLARPDPGDLPNNHLAYAGQWFFFALTALVIYVLALRRRAGNARAE